MGSIYACRGAAGNITLVFDRLILSINVKGQSKTPSTGNLIMAECTNIESLFISNQIRRTEHVNRMEV